MRLLYNGPLWQPAQQAAALVQSSSSFKLGRAPSFIAADVLPAPAPARHDDPLFPHIDHTTAPALTPVPVPLPADGRLTLHALRALVSAGLIDSVVLAFPDIHGRPMGKTLDARYFLAHGLRGSHACAYLLGCDVAMTPLPDAAVLPGTDGRYGDVELVPDMSSLCVMAWREKTAMVVCDVYLQQQPQPRELGGSHAVAADETTVLSGSVVASNSLLSQTALQQQAKTCQASLINKEATEQHLEVDSAPRTMLRRQLARARALGFTVTAATELEYYLLQLPVLSPTLRADSGHSGGSDGALPGFGESALLALLPRLPSQDYHLLQAGRDEPLSRALRSALTRSAVPVEGSKGEAGPGQQELNTRPANALAAADATVRYKLCVKDVARAWGRAATFMAKPFASLAGSGCHLHVNLAWADSNADSHISTKVATSASENETNTAWQQEYTADGDPVLGENAFAGRGGEELLRAFVGGVAAHTPAILPLFAPNPNAFARLRAAVWAPARVGAGEDSRAAALRTVGAPGARGRRLEVRVAGADANPYLALAAVVAAGLDGVERARDAVRESVRSPGAATMTTTMTAMTRDEVARMGAKAAVGAVPEQAMPRSLREALALWSAPDSFARRAFGDATVEHLGAVLVAEQDAFELTVGDWERERYFEQV